MALPQPDNTLLAKNNFDLLRLLFAGTVCLVHAHQLSGFQQLAWIENILSSAVAVKAFFVVSGFLIFMSFERSTSIATYAGKRLRRIYPAYFTVVMLCAIAFFPISSKGFTDYFSMQWIQYVVANLTFLNFLQPTLPGVFELNKFAAVNGALWTLKIEVMFYLSVPFFVFLFRRFGHLWVLAITYCLSIVYLDLLTSIAEHTGSEGYFELSRQLPGQLSYFIAGGFFYYYPKVLENHKIYFLVVASTILFLNKILPIQAIEPLALGSIVIFFGLFLYVGNFGKYGDFSYGVYILHFPIIQLFISHGWLADKPWLFLAAVATSTIFSAAIMWHLVEKRFLARNSHYVAKTLLTTEVLVLNRTSKQQPP